MTRQGKRLIAPRPSTRENGARGETTGKRAAGRYEMTTGEASGARETGWGKQARRGRHPPHRPTHEGTMAKIKAPLSTHHIDIADIMRQAARSPPPTRYHIARTRKASRSRPQIRHRPARRHEERGGERREAIRYERRSERRSGKQRNEAA